MYGYQQNAIEHWNERAQSWQINSYLADGVRWEPSNPAQVDLVFDAGEESTTYCYFDSQHCLSMEDYGGGYPLAMLHTFPDLNVRVLIWNTDDFDEQLMNPTYPEYIDGVLFYSRLMRHELGHDHFLANADVAGLMCSAFSQQCTPLGAATFDEMTTAEAEFVGRPQPPTSLSVLSVTPTSVQVGFSGASGQTSFNGYRSTSLSSWTQISGISSPYTFSGLTPGTTYNFRIASVGNAGWGESTSFWVTATTAPPPAPSSITSSFVYLGSYNYKNRLTRSAVGGANYYKVCWDTSLSGSFSSCNTVFGTQSDQNMPSGDGTKWYNKVKSCSNSGFCGPLSSDYIMSQQALKDGWNYMFTHYRSGSSTVFQYINWMSYYGVPIGLKLHIKNGSSTGSTTLYNTVCLASGYISNPVYYSTSAFTTHKLGTRGHTIGTYNTCGASSDHSGDAAFNRWGYIPPYTY
ncbi:MAG: fibronectin type III domain-containing protein [Dehalococcoidia bacterium]|nr:fibronectin type III domain-containing protein [Dehalococcoidia bacterium]